jgi:isocitrate dehydrogenase (NAD+)
MAYCVTLIPGDGIDPEITAATLPALEATGFRFSWDERAAGAEGIERRGEPLSDPAIESIRSTGVARKGPLATPIGPGQRSVNVALRMEFDLFANLRPLQTIIPGRCYEDIEATTSEFADHVAKLVKG